VSRCAFSSSGDTTTQGRDFLISRPGIRVERDQMDVSPSWPSRGYHVHSDSSKRVGTAGASRRVSAPAARAAAAALAEPPPPDPGWGDHDVIPLNAELHLLRQVGLLDQGAWDPDSLGVADPHDARLHGASGV
jgi:hypothetical protein